MQATAAPVVASALSKPVAPRPRSHAGLLAIVVIVAAALALSLLLRQKPAAPIVASPVAPPAIAAAPKLAPPVVAAPAPAPTDPPVRAYDGTLKLGLRRVVDGTTWSLRLLVIDDAGTPTITLIASGEGTTTEGAIAPEPDFARNNREPGIVFKDADVTVERRATSLVVRGPAGEKIVARLTEQTGVRAAPFARARYDAK